MRETRCMRPTRTLLLVVLSLAAVLVAAGSAAAGDATREPAVFASAELGPFELISSILVESDVVDQRGGWLNEKVSCLQKRKLHVKTTLFYQPPSGSGTEVVRKKKARVRNCAEGGPNLGFTRSATALGLACPDGTWQPGTYSLVTRTTHRKTKLRAVASLTWEKTGSC